MSLKETARQTLQIIEDGGYTHPDAGWVDLSEPIRQAVSGSRLFLPHELRTLLASSAEGDPDAGTTHYETTDERTQEAAHRLARHDGVEDFVILNFASARNPGGGFLNGAKAQEEDITRCSALYPCLLAHGDYYAANRAQETLLYTDHMIYAPRVPFFRRRNRDLSSEPFLASVITAPAPNAGEVLRGDEHAQGAIDATLRRRAGQVLALAHHHCHRTLVLGAWGCGVFRNDPIAVADAFGTWLEHGRFAGAFERVVFAVYDRSPDRKNLHAFTTRFSTGG